MKGPEGRTMTEGTPRPSRGGRPRKEQAERRSLYIGFWVTVKEKAAIEARAADIGATSIGHFARAAALSQPIRTGRTPTHSPELVAQLRRVGNNLNQCLREARFGNFPAAMTAATEEAIREVSALLRAQLHDPEH
jgi:hypothetical protein